LIVAAMAAAMFDCCSDGCGSDGLVAAMRTGNDESIGAMAAAVMDCCSNGYGNDLIVVSFSREHQQQQQQLQ
jgi:hypothetical protein